MEATTSVDDAIEFECDLCGTGIAFNTGEVYGPDWEPYCPDCAKTDQAQERLREATHYPYQV